MTTTFRVFHRTNNLFDTKNRDDARFIEVALVRCENLGTVFGLTNHIDRAWWDNHGVTVVGVKNHRSTSVGDEIEVVETGERFAVAGVGFEKVSS